MRQRAQALLEQERLSKIGAKGSTKKYQPGKDPLEQEQEIQDIRSLRHEEQTMLKKMINDMLKGETNRYRKKALLFHQAQMDAQEAEGMVQHEFLRDFWAWLLGRGKEADHLNTPWYRQALTDDLEVAAYVDSFLIKFHEYQLKLQVLKLRRPKGINETYLYFKYIVRGKEETQLSKDVDGNKSATNFLHDWQIFQNQFDWGRSLGNEAWDHGPEGHPHEVAPYGPLSKGASEQFRRDTNERIIRMHMDDDDDDDESYDPRRGDSQLRRARRRLDMNGGTPPRGNPRVSEISGGTGGENDQNIADAGPPETQDTNQPKDDIVGGEQFDQQMQELSGVVGQLDTVLKNFMAEMRNRAPAPAPASAPIPVPETIPKRMDLGKKPLEKDVLEEKSLPPKEKFEEDLPESNKKQEPPEPPASVPSLPVGRNVEPSRDNLLARQKTLEEEYGTKIGNLQQEVKQLSQELEGAKAKGTATEKELFELRSKILEKSAQSEMVGELGDVKKSLDILVELQQKRANEKIEVTVQNGKDIDQIAPLLEKQRDHMLELLLNQKTSNNEEMGKFVELLNNQQQQISQLGEKFQANMSARDAQALERERTQLEFLKGFLNRPEKSADERNFKQLEEDFRNHRERTEQQFNRLQDILLQQRNNPPPPIPPVAQTVPNPSLNDIQKMVREENERGLEKQQAAADKRTLDELREKVREQNDVASRNRADLDRANEKVRIALDREDELKTKVARTATEITELQNKLATVEAALKTAKAGSVEAEKEFEEEATQLANALAAKKADFDKLKADHADQMGKAKVAYDNVTKARNDALKSLEEEQKKVKELSKAISSATKEALKRDEELQRTKREGQDLLSRYKKSQEDFQKKEEELRSEREKNKALGEKVLKGTEMEPELERRKGKIADLEKRIAGIQGEHSEEKLGLEKKLREKQQIVEGLGKNAQEMQNKLEATEAKVRKLESQKAESDAEQKAKDEKLAKFQEAIRVIHEQKEQLKTAGSSYAKIKAELEDLKKSASSGIAREQHEAMISEKEKHLEAMRKENVKRFAENEQMKKSGFLLQQEREALVGEKNRLAAELENSQRRATELQQRNMLLMEELAQKAKKVDIEIPAERVLGADDIREIIRDVTPVRREVNRREEQIEEEKKVIQQITKPAPSEKPSAPSRGTPSKTELKQQIAEGIAGAYAQQQEKGKEEERVVVEEKKEKQKTEKKRPERKEEKLSLQQYAKIAGLTEEQMEELEERFIEQKKLEKEHRRAEKGKSGTKRIK